MMHTKQVQKRLVVFLFFQISRSSYVSLCSRYNHVDRLSLTAPAAMHLQMRTEGLRSGAVVQLVKCAEGDLVMYEWFDPSIEALVPAKVGWVTNVRTTAEYHIKPKSEARFVRIDIVQFAKVTRNVSAEVSVGHKNDVHEQNV